MAGLPQRAAALLAGLRRASRPLPPAALSWPSALPEQTEWTQPALPDGGCVRLVCVPCGNRVRRGATPQGLLAVWLRPARACFKQPATAKRPARLRRLHPCDLAGSGKDSSCQGLAKRRNNCLQGSASLWTEAPVSSSPGARTNTPALVWAKAPAHVPCEACLVQGSSLCGGKPPLD